MAQHSDRISDSDDVLLIPEPENDSTSRSMDDDPLLHLDAVTETESVQHVESEPSSIVASDSTPTEGSVGVAITHTDRPLAVCQCRWCRERVGVVERPRHRRRSHRARWRVSHCQVKCKEANLPAAFCSAIAVVLFCSAMAVPRWFHFHGGGCKTYATHEPVTSLGLTKFFYFGNFRLASATGSSTGFHVKYNYGNKLSDVLVDCVTREIVEYMRMVIALCFIGLTLAVAQFLLDVIGPTFRCLRPLHRNAFFSIFTVLTCVAIHGLCYWITELIENFQKKTRTHVGSNVQVSFGVSFYLIAAAGIISIASTAFSLMRCRWDSRHDRERLFGNYEGIDFGPEFGPHVSETCASMAPPAYTP
ncbi:hypothetical protein LSAT2_014103 [Lamellibrachia satsuma]|nr:hypothetical protein LSAT2_014103 [Lamellibrachia satsuma]